MLRGLLTLVLVLALGVPAANAAGASNALRQQWEVCKKYRLHPRPGMASQFPPDFADCDKVWERWRETDEFREEGEAARQKDRQDDLDKLNKLKGQSK